MTEAKLTIGHIARSAGVNIETVRYYQRRGLVALPPERTRGFRYYTLATASRVRFIKRALVPIGPLLQALAATAAIALAIGAALVLMTAALLGGR